MSQKNIDFGNYPDDPDADSIRAAFQKTQDNFTQLFAPAGAESAVTSINRTPGAGITVNAPTGNVVISANIACVQVQTSTLSIGRGANGNSYTSITASSQVLWVDLPETIANVGNIILDGNANIGGYANIVGNIYSGNANLGNLAVANFFSGDGSLLTNLAPATSITNGSSNVSVALNGNVTVGIGGTADVMKIASGNLFVKSVRNANSGNVLYYDATTKEITYDISSGGGGGNQLTVTAPVTNYQVNLLGGNVYIDPYTNYYLYCSGVASDSGGNIFLYGTNGGDFSAPLLSKYNSAGTLQWQKYFDESVSNFTIDNTGMIACDSSGNTYMVYFDFNGNNLNLVKVSTSGTLTWQRQIGLPTDPLSYNITVDSSDNVLLVFDVFSYSPLYNDVYAIKYNSSGTLQWQSDLDVLGSWPTGVYPNGICTDNSNNLYYVATNFYDSDTYPNSLLVKYDSSGVLQYAKQINNYTIHGVTVDSSGNIYLVGRLPNMALTQGLVAKLNSSCTQIWTSYFTSPTPLVAMACELYSSTLYVFGAKTDASYSYDGYVLAMSTSTGDIIWQNAITQPNINFEKPYPLFNDYDRKNMSGILSVNSNGILIAATYEPSLGSGLADLAYFNLPLNGSGSGVYSYFTYAPTSFNYVLSSITLVIGDSGLTDSAGSLTTGTVTVPVTTPTYSTFQEFIFPSGTRTFTLNANSIITFPDGTLQYSAFNPYLPNLYLGTPVVNSLVTSVNGVSIGPANVQVGQGGVGIGGNINTISTLNSIAIGEMALYANSSNANYTVAIGANAAHVDSKANVVAIGHNAGYTEAGLGIIAIGANAGMDALGNNSIAIGSFASNVGNSRANTIVINATGTDLNPTDSDSLYLKPIRINYSTGEGDYTLHYNDTTGEIISYPNGVLYPGTYSTANITLTDTDSGKYFFRNTTGTQTVTIPDYGSPYLIRNGSTYKFVQLGTGVTNIVPESASSSLYLAGNSFAQVVGVEIGAYGDATLIKLDNNTWYISGNQLTGLEY